MSSTKQKETKKQPKPPQSCVFRDVDCTCLPGTMAAAPVSFPTLVYRSKHLLLPRIANVKASFLPRFNRRKMKTTCYREARRSVLLVASHAPAVLNMPKKTREKKRERRRRSSLKSQATRVYDQTSSWYWFADLIFLTISSALASGIPRCSAMIWIRPACTSRAMLAASPQT